jgi:periplasmic divalent cation tolerance protein
VARWACRWRILDEPREDGADRRRGGERREGGLLAVRGPIQVLTTAGSEEAAERISTALLEARLAACVQVIGPIVSRYHWQGRLETATEWQCLAKTEAQLYPAVEQAIRAAHSYEEPEILAIPVLTGSAGYLAWIAENVGE